MTLETFLKLATIFFIVILFTVSFIYTDSLHKANDELKNEKHQLRLENNQLKELCKKPCDD